MSDPLTDNLPDIPINTSNYSREQKLEACATHSILGSVNATAKRLNIPRTTIENWKKETWWDETQVAIRQETRDKTLAALDRTIEGALEATQQRIEQGDPIVWQGEVSGYAPLRGKDAATVAAIFIDKRQILLNQPTSIRGDNSESMQQLMQQFRQIAEQNTAKVVSDQ